MKRGHFMAAMLMTLPLGILLAGGCHKPPPPPPNTAPTAFFDWCVAEHFGVKSHEQYVKHQRAEKIASGQLGLAEYNGVLANPVFDGKGNKIGSVACMTDEECARKLYQAIVRELRRVAEEKGVTLQGKGQPEDKEFAWKYRFGPNDGTLEGKYELGDTKDAGKDVKVYFVKFKLREVIRDNP